MASSKKRKTPVTGTSTKSRPSSTKTRSVIRKFHVLLKSRRKLEGRPGNVQEIDAIDGQIGGLGGLDAYQRMSKQGQSAERGGGTETVLVGWLKDIMEGDPLGKGQKLRCVWTGPQYSRRADSLVQVARGGGLESGQLSRVFLLDRQHTYRPQCARPWDQTTGLPADERGRERLQMGCSEPQIGRAHV